MQAHVCLHLDSRVQVLNMQLGVLGQGVLW